MGIETTSDTSHGFYYQVFDNITVYCPKVALMKPTKFAIDSFPIEDGKYYVVHAYYRAEDDWRDIVVTVDTMDDLIVTINGDTTSVSPTANEAIFNFTGTIGQAYKAVF